MKGTRDTHHRIPQSRVGEFGLPADFDGNEMKTRKEFHRAWHRLFDNMTPAEVILVITFVGKNVFVSKKKKQKAWQLLFGGLAIQGVIKEIETKWMGPKVAEVLGYPFPEDIKVAV